jgi:ATP-binding cassette subfamily A (ABC1) protein 3
LPSETRRVTTRFLVEVAFWLLRICMLPENNAQVDVEPVQKLVASHIEGTKPLSNVGTEFSLKLPSSETPKFADMLDELERNQTALGIMSYGISATTLEEVFLRVAQGTGAVGADSTPAPAPAPATSSAPAPVFLRGGALKVQQFKALMMKRLLNMRRDYKAVFTQLLGPVIFVLVALSIQGVRPPSYPHQLPEWV